MPKPQSIQSRLLKSLLIGLPLLWLATTAMIGVQLWHEINEINDSQVVQLTRYLLSTAAQSSSPSAAPVTAKTDTLELSVPVLDPIDVVNPTIYQLDNQKLSVDLGEAEADYIGFAIWDKTGKLLMADENGKNFAFLPDHHGFLDDRHARYQYLNPFSRDWRLFYLHEQHQGRVIAVGQNLVSRQEILTQAILAQTLPSLIGLTAFLLFVIWSVRQGFAPLYQVSRSLIERHPHDDTPLSADVPKEIEPLVVSLNALLVRVAHALEREKRFTADASHELRSPLTALKLQADILEQYILHANLPEADETALFRHTRQIGDGVERATHLVEQLLVLAKLAPEQRLEPDDLVPIDWLRLTDTVLSQVNRQAREKHSQLRREILAQPSLPLMGNPTLLELLLRNLLDNAIRYCPNGSVITVVLDAAQISVIDNGGGVTPDNLARLTQRFFRPAGQTERGSGLGLSIVKRIAELHGLSVSLNNRLEHSLEHSLVVGFVVTLQKIDDLGVI